MSIPSSLLEKCLEKVKFPKIVVGPSGRSACFLNPVRSEIVIVDVDCWLGEAGVLRSDFIVCRPEVVDVIVELKGKDIEHGVDQIVATAKAWRGCGKASPAIGGVIVFTRSPARSAALDNIRLRTLKQHRIWLEMGKSGLKDYTFDTFSEGRV
jgi:hypothetical protein